MKLFVIAAFLVVGANAVLNRGCYFSIDGQYRKAPVQHKPKDIDPTLCSHIFFAFVRPDGTSGLKWADPDVDPKQVLELQALKGKNHDLKLMASIGGSVDHFKAIISSAATMTSFTQGAIKFLRHYQFEGLDIDYEYPKELERDGYARWLQIMADGFKEEGKGKTRLILSAAVSTVRIGYDVPKVAAAVDLINVMGYDYAGYTWSPGTGHNAPLNQLQNTIKNWIAQGAPANKIMFGMPTYARSFHLKSSSNTGVGAPFSGPGLTGKYNKETAFMSYFETCMAAKCKSQKYTVVFDEKAQAPYMYNPDGNWITAENVQSIEAKVQFAMSQKLAGVFIWKLDDDDFLDMCKNGVTYPLLRTINNVIRGEQPPKLSGEVPSNACDAIPALK